MMCGPILMCGDILHLDIDALAPSPANIIVMQSKLSELKTPPVQLIVSVPTTSQIVPKNS